MRKKALICLNNQPENKPIFETSTTGPLFDIMIGTLGKFKLDTQYKETSFLTSQFLLIDSASNPHAFHYSAYRILQLLQNKCKPVSSNQNPIPSDGGMENQSTYPISTVF